MLLLSRISMVCAQLYKMIDMFIVDLWIENRRRNAMQ